MYMRAEQYASLFYLRVLRPIVPSVHEQEPD